jgi:uncharacterized protein
MGIGDPLSVQPQIANNTSRDAMPPVTAADISRRALLMLASAAALIPSANTRADPSKPALEFAAAFPLEAVRLKPSIYRDAVESNRKTLHALEPDRLLHNFRVGAGLAAKGAAYGGWEGRGIAGHTLGHYLSACSLLHAQTGDRECFERVRYIVTELAACQAAHGDGYVGGTTVERDGKILDGKIVFEEVRHGEIRAGAFDLNGGWVPLYTWHKVHAGLLDAHRYCGSAEALQVAVGVADYLIGVFHDLDDDQVQQVLAAEHGGLNESYAETYLRTGNRRHLEMAERIRHKAVLDPLTEERNILPGLHANTQIPKVIGLARLYELTGESGHNRAVRFFWDRVVRHHSYVIGGNSEREHFGPSDVLSPYLTDRTCEACNSYNMLKLTRHLFAWQPDAALFDYYERAHLNHIMAHQHPTTGMFAYFMPMTSGTKRHYSTLTDTFWCCMGSGMESHAKHGDSIYWHRGDTLFVNLFIPSVLTWDAHRAQFELDTDYPSSEEILLSIKKIAGNALFTIALRVPGWCAAPHLAINGQEAEFDLRKGYAVVRRRWRSGDTVKLTLPMSLRTEPTPDDPRTVAFLSGPVVLAADLGPAEHPFAGPAPALVSVDALSALQPVAGKVHVFETKGGQPAEMTLRPLFAQYDRRTAVYLPLVTQSQWESEDAAWREQKKRDAEIEARTVDAVFLGESQSELEHGFRANQSEVISYARKSGRQSWWGTGTYIEFDMAVTPEARSLRALYWGDEVNKNFDILIDGIVLVTERREEAPIESFVAREYAIPIAMTEGKSKITVRFETRGTDAPVYECRILRGANAI